MSRADEEEQAADKRIEAINTLQDGVEQRRIAILLRQPLVQLSRGADGGQWIANLMSNAGQKSA